LGLRIAFGIPRLKPQAFSGDTMANDSTQPALTDDWTVPKLLGIAVLVLGGFFVFIYNISP
jgi:hypothetical protein